MPSDQEVRDMKRYYPDASLVHWYDKGFSDALRTVRRDIGPDLGMNRPAFEMSQEEITSRPKRKRNKWVTFLKRFKFRDKRKNESSQSYLRLRTKKASREWKKKKGKK